MWSRYMSFFFSPITGLLCLVLPVSPYGGRGTGLCFLKAANKEQHSSDRNKARFLVRLAGNSSFRFYRTEIQQWGWRHVYIPRSSFSVQKIVLQPKNHTISICWSRIQKCWAALFIPLEDIQFGFCECSMIATKHRKKSLYILDENDENACPDWMGIIFIQLLY